MSHHHDHEVVSYNRAFAIGVSLNAGFVVIEAVYGVLADSLALLADAGHNLGDVFSLLLAWGAALLARRRPLPRRTYGYRKATVLAALGGALLLLIALGAIAWEAIGRFRDPAPVRELTVIVVAGVGVVVTGLAIMATGWFWLDPAASLAIVAIVLVGTWGLLRDSLNLAMDAVPANIDPAAVHDYLEKLPGVAEVHDLHIWAMSTTESALTAHLVMPNPPADDGFLQRVARELHERFEIGHPTIQIERGDTDETCDFAPSERV